MNRLPVVSVICAAAITLAGCGSDVPSAAVPASELSHNAAVSDPTSISLDRLGVESDLIPTGVDQAGGFVIPTQAEQASWFEPGPEPGQNGRSLILGHVNLHGQQGVFSRLHEARQGDVIEIEHEGAPATRWEVTQVMSEEKADWNSLNMYQELDHPQIALITCGGDLIRTAEGATYDSNVIVFARPA